MLHKITPLTAYAWAIRTVAVAGPLSLAMLVGWGVELDIAQRRPQLFLMLYMLLLLVAVCGFAVAVTAGCYLAVSRAFRYGYRAGVGAAMAGDVQTLPDPCLRPSRQASLTLVE